MYHYHLENRREISNISYIQNNRKIKKQIIFISPLLLFTILSIIMCKYSSRVEEC